MMSLFQLGEFNLHSGGSSNWKIECDSLDDGDVQTLAMLMSRLYQVKDSVFLNVFGVPQGGVRFADALRPLVKLSPRSDTVLLVDDVMTTGQSMGAMRIVLKREHDRQVCGVVAFARMACPYWINPVFQVCGKQF